MKPLEKLYSDVLREARYADVNACARLFVSAVVSYDRTLEDLANDLISDIETRFSHGTEAQTIADYFANLYSFVTAQFDSSCDFTEADWQNVYASVTALEEELPIELLQTYLSVFLERGII